jgi:biopolymer transport protein ExbD
MAFGSFSNGSGSAPMAEINMVPLIDVMLVLLVIFMVTAPLLTHAVKIDLPKASSNPNITRPDHVSLAIDAAGRTWWNGEVVTRPELAARLARAAAQEPKPELHLRADRATPYQHIADVMAGAARAGVTRIGFVTDPSQAASDPPRPMH